MAEGTWNPVPGRADGGGGVLVSTAWGPLDAFAEALAGTSPDGVVGVLHQGLALALRPTLQVDARLGIGLTEVAPAVVAGAGLRVTL